MYQRRGASFATVDSITVAGTATHQGGALMPTHWSSSDSNITEIGS